MNRDIKFRAWSPKWGKMIYHGIDGYTINVMSNTAWRDSCDDEAISLMQYTVMKDKEGKEIYEEDILLVELREGKEICIVKWEDDRCGFKLQDINEDLYGFSRLDLICTVIGNIYENKELIEQK